MKLDFFYCYDINLRNFLVSNKYAEQITYALHPKTNNQFWLFVINERLNKGIKEYKRITKRAKIENQKSGI